MSALPSTGRADHPVLGADETQTLYERHGSRIFAFCLSRLGTREEAEDATQTTFLNAFRSLRGGLVPAFELAWLFRIADNVCRDRRKAAWRRNRLEAAHDLAELQDVLAAPERGSEGLDGLGDALASMPERQRRAILLREWQGLSYGEIAAELGVSRAAVETLIFRARRSLARGLDETRQGGRRAGFDAGSLLGLAKALFQGGAAAKVAASIAVVAGAGLVVAAPLRDSHRERPAVATIEPARDATSFLPRPKTGPPANARPAEAAQGRPGAPRAPEAKKPAAGSTPSGPATTPTPPVTAPAGGGEARPEPPTPTPPPPAEELPAAGPLPPPPLPGLPEALPLPDVPTVEPPPPPEVPDLPVDVPDLPVDVPDLPGLPG
jgi:RNA polymerase sigma-70 factor (ECF subfamily)